MANFTMGGRHEFGSPPTQNQPAQSTYWKNDKQYLQDGREVLSDGKGGITFGTVKSPWEELLKDRPQISSSLNGGFLDKRYQLSATPYLQGLDSKMSSLSSGLNNRLGNINLDKRGLEAFRGEALRKGPSAWYNMMLDKQKLEEQGARDTAAKQALSQGAQARSQLAMRGGLMGGSAERMAKSSARDLMMANQDVSRQGMLTRAQLGVSDEEKRITALGQLPGMEVAALQPELQKTQMWADMGKSNLGAWQQGQQVGLEANKWNLQQTLDEKRRKDQYELDKWKEMVQAQAAEKQAQATERS
jgi:hypothetical protein